VKRPVKDLTEFLQVFWAHQDIMNSTANIERISFEVVEDCARDNVRILELRYSPFFVAINHPSLTFEGIHAAVVRGIKAACQRYPTIAVGLIGIVDRSAHLIISPLTRFSAKLAGSNDGGRFLPQTQGRLCRS